MQNYLRKFLKKRYLSIDRQYLSIPRRVAAIEKNLQNLLSLNYLENLENIDQKKILRLREFKIFSQNGEDGLLLYIFSKIGVVNRTFIEMGIDDGRECNSANLSINFGWKGIMIEKDTENVKNAINFYHNIQKIKQDQVKIIGEFINAENINQVLTDNEVKKSIDLLSIDIDGNDYWIWKAIKIIDPRVVVIEYNGAFGYERSYSVKYDPLFNRFKKHTSGIYHGASLPALKKLANLKGYILIGCDSSGTNAFFIKKNIAKKIFKELSTEDAYYPSPTVGKFNLIKDLKYQTV